MFLGIALLKKIDLAIHNGTPGFDNLPLEHLENSPWCWILDYGNDAPWIPADPIHQIHIFGNDHTLDLSESDPHEDICMLII
jgi:hypothetical protein